MQSMESPEQLEHEWTIDQLATETGVPSRTIREYQRLGLLPSPRREGRIGRYGAEHRTRLAIVGRLQDRGYSLAAIGDLMGSWEQGRGLGSVLGVDPGAGILDEIPTEISLAQLREIAPVFEDPGARDQALASGVIHGIDDESVAIRSIAAIKLIGLVTEEGIPAGDAIEMVGSLRSAAAEIASSVVNEFIDHIWPRRDEIDLVPVLSRARLLLAQASASLLVHELGTALNRQADLRGSEELRGTIDRVAVGQVRRLTSVDSDD